MASAISGKSDAQPQILTGQRFSAQQSLSVATGPATTSPAIDSIDMGVPVGLAKEAIEQFEFVDEERLARSDERVAGDSRRRTLPPGQEWQASDASLRIHGGLETEVGPGIAVGFDASFKMKARALHAVPANSPEHEKLRDLIIPLSGEALMKRNPAPGTEYSFKGIEALEGEVTAGLSEGVTLGPIDAGVSAGAEFSVEGRREWVKSLKYLGNGEVFMMVGSLSALKEEAFFGAKARIGFDFDVLPVLSGILESIAQKPFKHVRKSTLGASTSNEHANNEVGVSVFNLNKPEDLAQFNAMMRGLPSKTVEALQARGTAYDAKRHTRERGFDFNVFGLNFFHSGSEITHENGVLRQDGKTEHVEEVRGKGESNGLIPEWFGSGGDSASSFAVKKVAQGDDGIKQLPVELGFDEPYGSTTGAEVNKWLNFGRAMGFTATDLPERIDADREFKKAHYELKVVVPDKGVARIGQLSREALFKCAGQAESIIEGSGRLNSTGFIDEGTPVPAWAKPEYQHHLRNYENDVKNGVGHVVRHSYSKETGREDVFADIKIYQLVDRIWNDIETIKASGRGDLKAWKHLVDTIERTTDAEQKRLIALVLRQFADAQIVEMRGQVDEKKVEFAPEVAAPVSLDEYVGSILAPPN